MPSVITDAMVKEQCSMSRPIPMKAIGMLNPNSKVGFKPSYVKNRGRSGIRYTEQPTYAPASVNSLVQSICNITKLDGEVVENYLENRIQDEVGVPVGGGQSITNQELLDILGDEEKSDELDGPAEEQEVSKESKEIQTRMSTKAKTRPLREGQLEEGKVITTDPSAFKSAASAEDDIHKYETGVGTGELDVRSKRGVQGGVVGRPETSRPQTRSDTQPVSQRLRGSEF